MNALKHPLQSVFNLNDDPNGIDIEKEYGSTELANVKQANTTVTSVTPAPDPKDADDQLVEKRMDDVYDAAMNAYQSQTAFVEVIDPKFAARNAEVAANFLNIALSAAVARGRVKVERKRANTFIPFSPGGNKTTQNFIVADRNEILKMMTIDNDEKKL